MVNPLNYVLGGADPVRALYEGVSFGQGLQDAAQNRIAQAQNMEAQRQNMGIQAAQEARTVEMQPLLMQEAQLGLRAGEQNIEAQAQNMELQRQQQAQAQAAADAQAARQEAFGQTMMHLADLGASATFEDYQRASAQFPELAESINESWSSLDKNRQAGMRKRLMDIGSALRGGNAQTAIDLAEEYADAAENSKDPQTAATARAFAETVRMNPDAALASLGMILSGIDPEGSVNLFGSNKVQSSQLVGNGRVAVQNMTDGTVRVVDSATGNQLTGQDAQDALAAAEQAGITEQAGRAGARAGAVADVAVDTGEQVKAAESLGGTRGKMLESAGETISNINSTVRNIDRAIKAIDEGAGSGVLERYLPNVTEASAELNNAMIALGLDVIGSVTFGALSEGELNLALEAAVPRGLNQTQLRNWLQSKKEAQNKVKQAVLEQAQFLSNPKNTLQDWYNEVGVNKTAPAEDGAQPAQDRSAAQGEPVLSDEAFLEAMAAKRQRGEAFTPAEIARGNALMGQ